MDYSHLKYSDLTDKIIRSAMKVHRHFGSGFSETVYKRSLMIELGKVGLQFDSEVEKDIYYSGQLIGKRRLDLIVENKILIELKAIKELDKSCYNQIINYLKVFDLEVGLLLNFGEDRLMFKRFVWGRKNP